MFSVKRNGHGQELVNTDVGNRAVQKFISHVMNRDRSTEEHGDDEGSDDDFEFDHDATIETSIWDEATSSFYVVTRYPAKS